MFLAFTVTVPPRLIASRALMTRLTSAISNSLVSTLIGQIGAAFNDMIDQTTVYTMNALGYLCEQLLGVIEGGSNALMNTVLYASSDASSGLTHSTDDMPIVVAGGGGGSLVHPGVHYRSGTGENNSDILLACLQAVVPEATEVGSANGYSNTPCAALKA